MSKLREWWWIIRGKPTCYPTASGHRFAANRIGNIIDVGGYKSARFYCDKCRLIAEYDTLTGVFWDTGEYWEESK